MTPLPPNAKQIYQGPLLSLYQWDQILFDGTTTTFESVVRPDSTAVIAFLDPQTVIMTTQTQPHKSVSFVDVPGGRVDPGETLLEAGIRELYEETGYHAERAHLYTEFSHTSLVRCTFGVAIATDLKRGTSPRHQDAGEKIEVTTWSWDQLVQASLKRTLRSKEAMLAILGLAFDPEQRAWLTAFLSGTK